MNTYLLKVQSYAWVIDAGGTPEPLLHVLAQEGLSLQGILLTHAHIDHVEGLLTLHQAYPKVPIWLHTQERCWWDTMAFQASYFHYPVVPELPETAHVTWLHHDALHPDLTLTFELAPQSATLSFQVLPCPGHTPGGVSFYCPELKLVFTGDTLFKGGVGRWDFPYGDPHALEHSIRTALLTLPLETQVFSGHGLPTTIASERMTPDRYFSASC
ncbi:MAG: MBL fold metallo-hydrolase [Vampirovibrionales bacterium]